MSRPLHVRIASRGSELALWQAGAVRERLVEAHADLEASIAIVRTTGDRIQDVPLARIGDRGLFTKELDEALLDGRADLAVHSLKDVPTRLPPGLVIAAVTEREDPRDVLLARDRSATLDTLPPGSRVGTSSLRRRAQLRSLRSDLEVLDLRGNLNTRLARLDGGEYEAIILAAAGVKRLGWSERIVEWLPSERWIPAVGQGALAVVCREEDADVRALLHALHHSATAACVAAERAFLRALEGGCQIPIGALAALHTETLELEGFVSDLEGVTILRGRLSGSASEPDRLGSTLADHLIARGAADVLAAIRADAAPPPISGP